MRNSRRRRRERAQTGSPSIADSAPRARYLLRVFGGVPAISKSSATADFAPRGFSFYGEPPNCRNIPAGKFNKTARLRAPAELFAEVLKPSHCRKAAFRRLSGKNFRDFPVTSRGLCLSTCSNARGPPSRRNPRRASRAPRRSRASRLRKSPSTPRRRRALRPRRCRRLKSCRTL